MQDVVEAVGSLDEVAAVRSPLDEGQTGLVSADQASALVQVEFAGSPDDAADKTDAVVAAVADVQEAHPDFYVGSFGESTNKALQDSFADDLKTAGLYSVPLTLVILLVRVRSRRRGRDPVAARADAPCSAPSAWSRS